MQYEGPTKKLSLWMVKSNTKVKLLKKSLLWNQKDKRSFSHDVDSIKSCEGQAAQSNLDLHNYSMEGIWTKDNFVH